MGVDALFEPQLAAPARWLIEGADGSVSDLTMTRRLCAWYESIVVVTPEIRRLDMASLGNGLGPEFQTRADISGPICLSMNASAILREQTTSRKGVCARTDRALFVFQCDERVHLRGPQGWDGASQKNYH